MLPSRIPLLLASFGWVDQQVQYTRALDVGSVVGTRKYRLPSTLCLVNNAALKIFVCSGEMLESRLGKKLKLIIADDTPAMLQNLLSLLETEFDVVSTAENGQLAFECARRFLPDVAVLDLGMPLLNGIEVTRKLKRLGSTPAVVICSVENAPEIVEAARQAGALGYVLKKHMARDLIAAVKSAVAGKWFVSAL